MIIKSLSIMPSCPVTMSSITFWPGLRKIFVRNSPCSPTVTRVEFISRTAVGRVLPDTVTELVETEILLSGLSISINSPGVIVGVGIGVGTRPGVGVIVGAIVAVGIGVASSVGVGGGTVGVGGGTVRVGAGTVVGFRPVSLNSSFEIC